MSDDKPMMIDRPPHGQRPSAVVCRHMLANDGARVGFVENSDDPTDLQAWCDACETMFLHEGDKTDAFIAFNDFAIVCVVCYADIKARHSHVSMGGPN